VVEGRLCRAELERAVQSHHLGDLGVGVLAAQVAEVALELMQARRAHVATAK
jgi:hypothetical protein